MNKTTLLNKTLAAIAISGAFFATSHTLAAEIPQSATLKYSGSYNIPATMEFKRNGDNYTVSANINVPLYKIRFESGGKIVGNQLKPTYYTDTRNGKVYASARFNNGKALYGRPDDMKTENVSGQVMDLFTLSWQLAFNDGKLPANLKVTNGKKLYAIGGARASGSQTMKIGGQSIQTNKINVRRGDDDVVYAFAPTLNNVPALINYNDGSKKYHLTLQSVSINGKPIKP